MTATARQVFARDSWSEIAKLVRSKAGFTFLAKGYRHPVAVRLLTELEQVLDQPFEQVACRHADPATPAAYAWTPGVPQLMCEVCLIAFAHTITRAECNTCGGPASRRDGLNLTREPVVVVAAVCAACREVAQ